MSARIRITATKRLSRLGMQHNQSVSISEEAVLQPLDDRNAHTVKRVKDAAGTAFRPHVLDTVSRMCQVKNLSHQCYKNA